MAAETSPATKPLCHAVVMYATDKHGQGKGRATKLLTRVEAGFEVQGEPVVSFWHWERVPVDGLDDIMATLRRLAGDPSAVVVGDTVRRNAPDVVNKAVVEHEGKPAPDLRRRDRRWLAFDNDGWTPPGWPLPATPTEADIRAAVRALVDTLGPAFEGAECVYRLSATAGLVAGNDDKVRVPGWQRLRCHVWLWLDRPVAPASVKGWCSALFPLRKNAKGRMEPVDPLAPHWDHGMFDGARIHYVADPVVKGADIADIVPVGRIGRLPGRAVVAPVTWRTLAEMAADEARANAEGAAYLAQTRPASRLAEMCWRSALKVIDTEINPGSWTSKGAKRGASPEVYLASGRAFSGAIAAEQAGRAGSVDEVEAILLAQGVKQWTASAARKYSEQHPKYSAESRKSAQEEMDEADARAPTTSPATKPLPVQPADNDDDEVPWFGEVEVEAEDPRDEAGFEDPRVEVDVGPFCIWEPGVVARVEELSATKPLHSMAEMWCELAHALDHDPLAWSAKLVATLGGQAQAEAASSAGVGVVGERCRAFLRRAWRVAPELVRGAGLLTRKGPWPPMAKGAAEVCLLPVFGPHGVGVVGLYAVDAGGAFLGRLGAKVPVAFGSVADDEESPATKPLTVLVCDPLDAAVYVGNLGLAAPLDPVQVVAVGDETPDTVREVIARAGRIVVATAGAWSRGPEVAVMAAAVGVPVAMVRTSSATWRQRDEEGRQAAVMLWAEML